MWAHVAAGATNESTRTELAQAPRNSEQPPTQNAGQAEDARTEQHYAAGLRDRRSAIGATGAAVAQGESFRRNRAQGVLIGGRRTAVLIPVDRVANRAAGGGASIAQSRKARTASPRNVKAGRVCLVQEITILVSTQEGVGRRPRSWRCRRTTWYQAAGPRSSEDRWTRHPSKRSESLRHAGSKRERVANGEAKVNRPGIVGAVVRTVVICVGHGRSNSQHQAQIVSRESDAVRMEGIPPGLLEATTILVRITALATKGYGESATCSHFGAHHTRQGLNPQFVRPGVLNVPLPPNIYPQAPARA